MSNQRFHYDGPATIDGVQFPNVQLQEDDPEGGLRLWEGAASFLAADAPPAFLANLSGSGSVPVELPDGRRGELLVTTVNFDEGRWTLDLAGTGPAPA